MMAAGIPLVQAFEIVGNGHEKPAMQKLILDIKADVEGGTSLHEALGKHPLYFDELFVNLVEAGEQAGALEALLDKIATYKEKTEALKKKVKKALFYPAAVLVVALVVTVMLLIFVIPEFESLFKGFGADLPAFTQMVINLSQLRAARRASSLRWSSAGLIWTFFYFQKRSRAMREFLDRLIAEDSGHRSDPQQVGHRALCAHALDHVRRRRAAGGGAGLGGRRHRQHRLREGRAEDARRGRHRAAPAARHGEHRPVSEHGGADDRRRRGVRLARRRCRPKSPTFYEAEVDNAVDGMSSLLEPLIMVVLGVLVGGIVIAMYLPIFKLGSVV